MKKMSPQVPWSLEFHPGDPSTDESSPGTEHCMLAIHFALKSGKGMLLAEGHSAHTAPTAPMPFTVRHTRNSDTGKS